MGADQNIDWAAHAASTLNWWREAGVDASIDEAPRNWLRPIAKQAAPAAPGAPATIVAEAPAIQLPDTLAAFEAWRNGPDAPEADWPGNAVVAQGSAQSGLMVLIDQPERDDADTGVLMSGATGRLFDRMLAAIGRDRASIYLVAVAAKRSAGGRVSPDVEARLAELARHHVSLAAPQMLLLLGNAPSRALLGADAAKMRGGLHPVNQRGAMVAANEKADGAHGGRAVASFHPRFLLERPAAKAEAWKDLQMLIGGLAA